MRFGVMVGLIGSLVGSAAVAGVSYVGVDLYKDLRVQRYFSDFDKLQDALDVEVKYGHSVGQPFSGEFVLENVTVVSDDKRVEIDKVEIKRFDWSQPRNPRYSTIVLTGMKFKGDVFGLVLGPEIGKVLAESNFENVVVDAAFEHEAADETGEDPKTKRKVRQKRVSITGIKLDFRDLGTFTGEIELRDFDVKPKAAARQTTELPPLVRLIGEGVQFAGMRVVYEDKGLMRAFFDARARELGIGELQARGRMVRDLQRDAQATRSAVNSNRFDKDFFAPIIHYIERFDRLTGFTLEAKPPQSIEIRRLFVMLDQNRGGFFERFNPRFSPGAARAPAPRREEPRREERKREEPRRR